MDYNTADIRQFLNDAYSDQELTALCFDYFREVYDDFAAGMTKGQKIQRLLEYVEDRGVIPNLLASLEKTRPAQYKEKFAPVLKPEKPTEPIEPREELRQVFISHATRADGDFARRLAADLKPHGWRAWVAPKSIRPGEKWAEAIENGVKQSQVFILVLTPDGLNNDWVRFEADFALGLAIRKATKFIQILAKLCKEEDIPGRWSQFQRISFLSSYQEGLEELLAALKGQEAPKRPAGVAPTSQPELPKPIEVPVEVPRKKRYVDSGKMRRSTNRFLIVCGGAGVGLLGQRKVLGVDGEMHIDVREAVNYALSRDDPFSTYMKLDLPAEIGTAHQLLVDMKRRIGKTIRGEEYERHTLFLADNWPGDEPLKDGLARAPAFGGGAIRQLDNLIDLDSKLKKMINEWSQDIGPANPLEFWIISSTSGGTGEGTHRFVAERIVEILTSKHGVRVVLNFIRIGQATYNAIDPDRTSLNTFFGIAADAAFKVQIPKKYEEVGVATRWFYLEVPPVGVGPAAKPIRARLIELVAKAIMLNELSEVIDMIVVNDGIGLVRVGYWGKDFDESLMYLEMLNQLLVKLKDLIEPDGYAKYVFGKREPDFEGAEGLQKARDLLISEDYIYKQMNKGWEFPQYTAPRLPENPNEIWKLAQQWRSSIGQLIPSISIDELKPRFVTVQNVKKEGTEEFETRRVSLSVPIMEAVQPYTMPWFEKIDTAHQVKAWATALLGTGQGNDGLLVSLHKLVRSCSDAQHPSFPESLFPNTQKKANNLKKYLVEFIETLVKVIQLWELQRTAEEMLEGALGGAKKVEDVARQQQIIARGAIKGVEKSPVIAGDLFDPLDPITKESWLRMLDTAVRRQETELFRKQVLAGATGLTYPGLVSVLGLRANADIPEVKDELRQQMGRMYDVKGTEFEAQWWQGSEPPDIVRRFLYRILPKLETRVRAELGEGDGEIQYLYTGLGIIGLHVLAFEGLTRSTLQDMITTSAYLLRPFVPLVKKHLDERAWQIATYGRPYSKLRIVCAGVGGEPLYKPLLMEVGLTGKELKKLGEFYELYDPYGGQEAKEKANA